MSEPNLKDPKCDYDHFRKKKRVFLNLLPNFENHKRMESVKSRGLRGNVDCVGQIFM